MKIEPQLYALLWLFVRNPGVLLARQTLEQEVWAGRPVTDEAMRAALKKLRDILGDKARSPRFIKTIPKQGVKWLMPISHEQDTNAATPPRRAIARSVWIVGVVAVVLILSGYTITKLLMPAPLIAPKLLTVTRLTELSGSEVDADYHAGLNKLAFIHRDARNNPQQLYVKYLVSGVVTRLSWDKANYTNSYWSHDGKRLVFMRLIDQKASLHIAYFADNNDIERVDTLDDPGLADKFVIGWLHEDRGLLLAENVRANKQHRIFAYYFDDHSLRALTNPNVAALGDYKAALSPDGTQLAILRQEVAREAVLLVTSLTSGTVTAKVSLPFVPSRLIWNAEGNILSMSNFFGEHWRYDLVTNTLDDNPELPAKSLDLFASCGQNCYILRQHNGNFLDLQETPIASLTLHQSDSSAHASAQPMINGGRLLRRADAQDFPQYLNADNQLIFVTLQDGQFVFQQLTNNNQVTDVATLDRHAQLSSVMISPDNTSLAGSADGRIFIASLAGDNNVQPVSFITSAMEHFDNPVWQGDNEHLYVMQLTANQPKIVKLNITSQSITPVTEGLLAFTPLGNSEKRAVGITPQFKAVSLIEQDGKWLIADTLAQLDSASPNRWKVSGSALYFTHYKMPEAFLCRVALNTTTEPAKTCWSIGDNRFRLHFDIDTAEQKIMLVESLSAQSDIIKLVW